MGMSKLRGRSMHEEMFWRSRLNAAFRTGWACFMTGLILQIGSLHAQWVAFPVFAYVMSVTVVGESTLGKALQDTVGVLVGTIQGVGMTILVMQVFSPKRMSIGVAVACICISSFIITYPKRTHILAKRVALAHSSIIYITAVVQKEKMQEIFFPLRLAGTTIVGAACGLLALLVPLPRLAMFQVLSQTRLSARISCEQLKVMVDAFCAKDPTQASALNLQAKSLAKIGSTVHADIASKEDEMGWEVRRFLQARSKSLKQLTTGLVSLRQILVGMELALQEDMRPCQAPSNRMLQKTLKESLIYLTDWARLALRHTASMGVHKASPSHRQIIIDEGYEALISFDDVLKKVVSMASCQSDRNVVEDLPGKLSFEAQAAALFFLFNLKRFVEETKAMFLMGQDQSRDDGREDGKRAAAVWRLGSSQSNNRAQVGDATGGSDRGDGRGDIEAVAEKLDKDGQAEERRVCENCRNTEMEREKQDEEEAAAGRLHVGRWFRHGLKDREQLMTACKMSLAMALGAFLGFWFNNQKGYWADITLALGFTGAAKGGSFNVATLRSLGTVSGSIYGLLVALATESFPVLRLLALIPWVLFTSFLRQSKLFGYAGAVSAFNGAIVILARTNKDSSDQEFTVIRIVEAFLGMASFILVELLIFPRRAATLVKTDVTAGLATLRDFAAAAFGAPRRPSCCPCSRAAVEELRGMEKKVRSAMKRQSALVREATEEPQFWFSPFPARVFMKVIEEQGRMVELLHFVLSAYEQLRDIAEQAGIEVGELVAPLQSSMLIVEEKVLPTLEFLAKVLQVKPLAPPPPSAEDKLTAADKPGNDLEAGPPRFLELDNLMKAQSCNAADSSHVKACQFGDVAPQREKRLMETFEAGASHVICQLDQVLAAPMPAHEQNPKHGVHENTPQLDTLLAHNSIFLSLGALAFLLKRLLHHTNQIENVVHELLQEENPWNLIDFWYTSKSMSHLLPK